MAWDIKMSVVFLDQTLRNAFTLCTEHRESYNLILSSPARTVPVWRTPIHMRLIAVILPRCRVYQRVQVTGWSISHFVRSHFDVRTYCSLHTWWRVYIVLCQCLVYPGQNVHNSCLFFVFTCAENHTELYSFCSILNNIWIHFKEIKIINILLLFTDKYVLASKLSFLVFSP